MNMRDSKHGRAARARESGWFARHYLLSGCAALLAVSACSDTGPTTNSNPHAGSAGGGGTAGARAVGAAGTGVAATGVGGSAAGSSSGGAGGATAAGHGASGEPSAMTGGTNAVAGNGAIGAGGSLGSAGMGGITGTGGMSGSAGAPAAGSAGLTSGGDGNGAGSGGDATGCTRDLLQSTVDAYFVALAAHDASTLAVAGSVKFTENGKVLTLGQDGLWKTAGTLKYVQSALDTEICSTASEAVVPDGSVDIPFALRLKLENTKITEVETIAVRAGDYVVSGSDFPSDTDAIISTAAAIGWEDPVPSDQAATRDELTGWMDKYFKYFPNGVCDTDSSCKRLENGGGSFSCSAGASCATGAPPAKPQAVSHALLGDVETGIGAGFDLFTGADVDMHMFKMKGGKVYAVHAVLGAATSTGWD
jgi:hypothetical protein